ncbi:MAG: MFS transporter [Chloroflexi bacterium]|nr:MFS transporter [Chloroflexota bacterium]MDA1239395.1 MFS transporter [Chloroflexota bacterium]
MAADPETPDRTSPSPPAASGTAALPPPPPGAPSIRKKPSIADIFVSLKMRDFRYLTLSTLAAGFAQWAKQLALFALAYDMTGSAMQLATVAAFRGIVGTVVAPFGGYLSDRYPRRAVIVLSTALDVALAAILAALVIADVAEMWHVYAIALGGGLAQSINQPARQAFVYDVTTDETLQNAIAVNSMVQNISRVLGPSGVGVMMAVWGVASALVALVGLQLVAIIATLQISRVTRQVQAERGSAASKMMGEGFRYCWEDKRILGLVLVGTIPSLLVYPYIPFLKIISEEVLNQGNAGFGMLSSMMGWGSLIGLFALAYLGRVEGRGRLMLGCYLIYGVLLVGFSASSTYVLSLSILAIGGIFHSVAMALNNTLLLQSSRAEMRGRVMAVNQMTHGIQPLGSFLMGVAITGVGVQMGIGLFIASATVLFALFALAWGSVRRM